MADLGRDFQSALDSFVKRFGMEKGAAILKRLNKPHKVRLDEKKLRAAIVAFVVNECAKAAGLSETEVLQGTRRPHAEARWMAIHMVKFYTKSTYRELADHFGRKKRALMYAVTKCQEALEVPKFEKEFNERYQAVEASLIAYITKIKRDG